MEENEEYTTLDYLEQLISDKEDMVDNLINQGVEASDEETFTGLVPKVLDISGGGGGIIPSGTININNNGLYDVTTYANANVNVSQVSNYNSFKVNTIADRDNLSDVREGDTCIVSQNTIERITELNNTNITSVYIPSEVILPEAVSSFEGMFSSNGMGYYNGIDVYKQSENNIAFVNISTYDEEHGYMSYGFTYTTNDNIVYTLDQQQSAQPGVYNFSDSISYRNYYQWSDTIGYFVNKNSISFSGVYKAEMQYYNLRPLKYEEINTFTSFYLREYVTLPYAFTERRDIEFTKYSGQLYIRVAVWIDQYGASVICCYRNSDGEYEIPQFQFFYDTDDGIHYYRSGVNGGQRELLGYYNFVETPTTNDTWYDEIGYFLSQVENEPTPETERYHEVKWNTLDIGIYTNELDLLLNKNAYTSNGVITGTRDMNKYIEKGYIVSSTEPTDHENYPVWIEPYNDDYSRISKVNNTYYKIDKSIQIPQCSRISLPDVIYDYYEGGVYKNNYNGYFYYIGTTSSDATNKIRKIDMSSGSISVVSALPSLSYSASEAKWTQHCFEGNKIYYIPYRKSSSSSTYWNSNLFYVLNLDNGTFTKLSNLPNNIFDASIKYHHRSDTIFCVGRTSGSSDRNVCYKYNIANNSWSTVNVSSLTQNEQAFFTRFLNYGQQRINNSGYEYKMFKDCRGYKETQNFFEEIISYNDGSWEGFVIDYYNTEAGLLNLPNSVIIGENQVLSIGTKNSESQSTLLNIEYINDKLKASNIKVLPPLSYNQPFYVNVLTYPVVTNGEIIMLVWDDEVSVLTNSVSILKIPVSWIGNSGYKVGDYCSVVFTLEEIPIRMKLSQTTWVDSNKFNSQCNYILKDCFISEKYINPYASSFTRDNIVKKVYLYNNETEQYEVIINKTI